MSVEAERLWQCVRQDMDEIVRLSNQEVSHKDIMAWAMWQIVYEQPNHRIQLPQTVPDFCADVIHQYPQRFMVDRFGQLVALPLIQQRDGTRNIASNEAFSTPRSNKDGCSSSLAAARDLYEWILRFPEHTVNCGFLHLFGKQYPQAFSVFRGRLSWFVAQHPSMFEIVRDGTTSSLRAVVPSRTSSPTSTSYSDDSSITLESVEQQQQMTDIKPSLLNRKALEKNKGGMTILPNPEEISFDRFFDKVPQEFAIQNTASRVHHLVKVVVSDPRTKLRIDPVQVQFEVLGQPRIERPIPIPPYHSLKGRATWKENCPKGPVQVHLVEVTFVFAEGFSISRMIASNAGGDDDDAPLLGQLRPKQPYLPVRKKTPLAFPNSENMQFPRVLEPSTSLWITMLSVPEVPLNLEILSISPLNPLVYRDRFTLLLRMVQDYETKELELQDLRNIKVIPCVGQARRFSFPVPGLADRRPSVLVGDAVMAMECLPLDRRAAATGGKVVAVSQESVTAEFTAPLVASKSYHIRFVPNLYPFKMQYTALSTAVENEETMKRLLEPHLGVRRSARLAKSQTHSRLDTNALPCCRGLNDQQLQAVETIVYGMPQTRTAPFLVFGPPGTGKTTTLVAAVVSLLQVYPCSSKILVCAGSNSACDVFLDKLKKKIPSVRMERFLAAKLALKAPIQTVDDLETAKVIVSTCTASGKLSALQRAAFTHIFVDEAAQCTETETLIPLSLCGSNAQWVLGGDHKQLGPIIRDKQADILGRFGRSMFERIMSDFPMYEAELDPNFAVLLTNNYRSHPALVQIPSKLFYQNMLVPCASNVYSASDALGVKHPVIAQHVAGKEEREGTSPSWFNSAEVIQVVKSVRSIVTETGPRMVPPLQIDRGELIVIAPYARHVDKLRFGLRQVGFPQVKVDSVEKFQGDEARVVIISTARSSSIMDDYDAESHLGFLKNEKRFNVAVTRAKELLIVVGNINMLREDQHWGQLIDECDRNNTVRMTC